MSIVNINRLRFVKLKIISGRILKRIITVLLTLL